MRVSSRDSQGQGYKTTDKWNNHKWNNSNLYAAITLHASDVDVGQLRNPMSRLRLENGVGHLNYIRVEKHISYKAEKTHMRFQLWCPCVRVITGVTFVLMPQLPIHKDATGPSKIGLKKGPFPARATIRLIRTKPQHKPATACDLKSTFPAVLARPRLGFPTTKASTRNDCQIYQQRNEMYTIGAILRMSGRRREGEATH